jgi:hypothetical protein
MKGADGGQFCQISREYDAPLNIRVTRQFKLDKERALLPSGSASSSRAIRPIRSRPGTSANSRGPTRSFCPWTPIPVLRRVQIAHVRHAPQQHLNRLRRRHRL